MPFLGLLFTSGAFLLPAWIAKRKKKRTLAWACRILTVTSVWFHSQVFQRLAYLVDKSYAHTFAAVFSTKAVVEAFIRRSPKHILLSASSLIPISLYKTKVIQTDGIESNVWHMIFHLTGQTCIIIYANYF